MFRNKKKEEKHQRHTKRSKCLNHFVATSFVVVAVVVVFSPISRREKVAPQLCVIFSFLSMHASTFTKSKLLCYISGIPDPCN